MYFPLIHLDLKNNFLKIKIRCFWKRKRKKSIPLYIDVFVDEMGHAGNHTYAHRRKHVHTWVHMFGSLCCIVCERFPHKHFVFVETLPMMEPGLRELEIFGFVKARPGAPGLSSELCSASVLGCMVRPLEPFKQGSKHTCRRLASRI